MSVGRVCRETPSAWRRAAISDYDVAHDRAGSTKGRRSQHMSNQFQSGQNVRLVRSLSLRAAADGEFKIVRALPNDGGETQYRIKSTREPHDRVVKESDLQVA